MSTSLLKSLAAVSASLFLVVGCAVDADGPDGEEIDESSEVPALESSIDTQATGQTCACPAGKEYQNGLCYTPCAAGWNGEGPVCWQACASGFTDTGWFCQRDSKIISANTSKCPWYNKCGLGSSCSKCPDGYTNDGCTCRRDAYIYAQPSYGRGAGTTPTCSTY